MNRKIIIYISATAALFIAIISTLLLLIPQKAEPLGTLSDTNATVYINHTKIPSYGYDNRVFIAAEDLENFGAVIIKSDDGNVTVAYDAISENAEREQTFSRIQSGTELEKTPYLLYINGSETEHYTAGGYNIIPAESLKCLPHTSLSYTDNTYRFTMSTDIENPNIIEGNTESAPVLTVKKQSKVIVLDPGHGRPSSEMSETDKINNGWIYNTAKGQWGEWRHWKNNSVWKDCEGTDCNKYGDCWYPMANGDRSAEPDINLKNCLSAKKYLEELGYTVRLTRSEATENPSVTKRISYCYPNQDINAAPDADAFICIHSNAGGGRGSAYIELSGNYTQSGILPSYAADGNRLGKMINDEITASTSLSVHGDGKISGEGYLIAFNKAPITCGYMEIGFFDNQSDLAVLRSETDKIGKAIANGVDKFMKSE